MKFRFGILGTGNIARQFAASFKTSDRCVVAAVGSRTPESAAAFVAGHAPHAVACGSYDALLRRDDVDGVYVSLPNALHHEWTIKALRAGKHVLCEKPLAMSHEEAEEMFAEATRAGKMLVEAFMYVSHPLMHAVLDAVKSGRIGRVRHIRTSFCYRTQKIAGNVRFSPELGGGALMDIGCYCLHFSRLIAKAAAGGAGVREEGGAIDLSAQAVRHATGVDEQVAGLLRFPGDITATFAAGMTLQADNTATISGDEGYIEIPVPWKPPLTGARWIIARSTPPKQDGGAASGPPPREEWTVDAGKDLYALEADDFAATCAGEMSPRVSEDESLDVMELIEGVRESI